MFKVILCQVKNTPNIMALLQSHISQHISFVARQEIEAKNAPIFQQQAAQFGGQLPPQLLQQFQTQNEREIAQRIRVLTEEMVAEEQEAMEGQNTDPLVLLKQQELALRQAEMEMDAQLKGENQALKENQFDYKQVLDSQKLQKDYDLANLRADVARERANAPKQEG